MSIVCAPPSSFPRSPGHLRSPAVLVALLTACVAVPATDAAGQAAIGGHGVSAADAFGGSRGIGARVAFRIPLLPVEFLGTAEQLFPDCDDLDCSLQGLSLDVSLDLLPIPVLRPYVTGGYTIRRFDTGLGEGRIDRSGPNLGAGLNLSLSGFRVFGEARYEMVRAPERQAIVRIGVLFGG